MISNSYIYVLFSCLLAFGLMLFLTKTEQARWVRMAIFPAHRSACSFSHIDVCQAHGPGTNGTFLYIIWGAVGFGSELNQLLVAFAYSVASGRQFFVDSRTWNYGWFNDYFNLSTDQYNRSFRYEFLSENELENQKIEHLKTTRTGPQVKRFWKATRHVQTIPIKRKVAHYLWQRMNPNVSSHVRRCQAIHPSKYIGVHVRRGDKLVKEARMIPLMSYIDRIEKMAEGNRTQTIFIASDDELVIEEFRQLRPQWTFTRASRTRKNGTLERGHQQVQFNRLSAEARQAEIQLLLCDLQNLVNAQMVFCGMSSNICRLVQILRHQDPNTMISMDRSWYGT